jgi:copper(I)-binding protein
MDISTSARPVAGAAARLSPFAAGRWRAGPALLAVLLSGTLAGCYASQNAQTLQETPYTPGVDGAVGAMVLNDVYLETADTVPAGGSVALRGSFTDDSAQPDRLVAVSTPAATSVELLQPDGTVAADGIEVPGDGQVDATTGPVLVRLSGLSRTLSPQSIVPITFEFENAGRATLDDVPVAAPAQGQG